MEARKKWPGVDSTCPATLHCSGQTRVIHMLDFHHGQADQQRLLMNDLAFPGFFAII
jgi:hypothetical protein